MKTFTQDDQGIDFTFAVQNADETVFNLTGATVVFKMALPGATVSKISEECTLVVPANGTCKYTVQAGDLDTLGVYDAELQITIGSLTITAPLEQIRVRAQLP